MGNYGLVPGARPKSVNAQWPCPLCGHTDWCCRFAPDDMTDGILYGCQRITLDKGAKFTTGGTTYVCVGESKEGATVFEPIQQHAFRRPRSKYLKGENVSAGNFQPQTRQYEIEKPIAALPAEELSKRYNVILNQLWLEKEDREYLYSEGFTEEMIKKYKIVTFPEPDGYRMNNADYHSKLPFRSRIGETAAQQFGGTLEGVPGAYRNSKGKWTFAGLGGILFPIFDFSGNIIALRIRVKRRWYDENHKEITKEQFKKLADEAKAKGVHYGGTELGKYMYLSSYKEDEAALKDFRVKNRYDGGCRVGSCLGFYRPMSGYTKGVVYVTEGEKKSIITANKLNTMCINIPGVGLWSLLFNEDANGISPIRRLIKDGNNIIVVAYDADKEMNKAVLTFEAGLLDALKKESIIVGVASWDMEKGKGLDDLLNAGYKPSYEILV